MNTKYQRVPHSLERKARHHKNSVRLYSNYPDSPTPLYLLKHLQSQSQTQCTGRRLGSSHSVVLGSEGELLGHLVSGSSWQEKTGKKTHSEVCRGHKQDAMLPITALESTLSIIFCFPGFSFMCLCV